MRIDTTVEDCADDVMSVAEEHRADLVALLQTLVEAESPSDVPEAQTPVFELVEEALKPLGFRFLRLPGKASGGQLLARPISATSGTPAQLMLGHVDTVWPLGTLKEMPVEQRNGCLYGPGVFDMKGGIVQMVFALRALQDLSLTPPLQPVIFLNSDEEVGSVESRPRIRRLARAVQRTFVLEPALGPEGRLKTARKGVGRFTIEVQGRASHAGLDPEGGASAIVELSHVVQHLHALNDPERGITVNVGTIEGGQRPNVVAPRSRAEVDVRVRTMEDAKEVEQSIFALEPATPNVMLNVEGHFGRPPLERTPRNRALWHLAQQASEQLGLTLGEGRAGGASDGNETSLFSATLDGLGPVGDGAHAEHEHVDIDQLVERTALLALLLMADPVSVPHAPESEHTP
ncbi:MAG: M20 family metallopeptidase [Longimonas sp.]|uniref:M20 family metallopeptidase n=1 Tax=Longimonas sp. TaxID=2039626 RepID=UPI0039768F99